MLTTASFIDSNGMHNNKLSFNMEKQIDNDFEKSILECAREMVRESIINNEDFKSLIKQSVTNAVKDLPNEIVMEGLKSMLAKELAKKTPV